MSSEPSQRALEREEGPAGVGETADLTPILGANLRRLRMRRTANVGVTTEKRMKAKNAPTKAAGNAVTSGINALRNTCL